MSNIIKRGSNGVDAMRVDIQGGTIDAVLGALNITELDGNAISLGAGNTAAGTQRVVIATNQAELPVTLDQTSVDSIADAIATRLSVRYMDDITNASLSDIHDINAIATVGGIVPVGTRLDFNNADNSDALEAWILRPGTDAPVPQFKRRPQDYNALSNAVFWERNL